MDSPPVVSAIGRDPDAFEAFYREHLPWVRRFVARRAVVELVAVDGLSLADPARVLGISAGTARVRYHRARARLQDVLPSPFEVTA